MNIKRPIFWRQGLFLQPQHFQYADLRSATMIYPLFEMANPYFYGIFKIDINEKALSNFMFEIESGSFLLKDGSHLNYPEDSILFPRSFASLMNKHDQEIMVHLGIKKVNANGKNVTQIHPVTSSTKLSTRFAVESDDTKIPDFYTNGTPTTVETLSSVLKVFWGHELAEAVDYQTIPIAKLLKDGNTIHLSREFVPPCLSLDSCANLISMIKSIRDDLANRGRQLELYKRPVNGTIASSDPRGDFYRFALQVISYFTPMLFHYTDSPGSVHPWVVYGYLRQLVGGLSSLTDKVDFLGEDPENKTILPAYDHGNIGSCFKSVEQLVKRILNTITIGGEALLAFENMGSGKYVTQIPMELGDPSNRFYLELETTENFERLLDFFLLHVKIGSMGDVEKFSEYALPGITVTHMRIQPPDLPKKANTTYFTLDVTSPAWDNVLKERSLVMLWDNAPADLLARLIVLRT